MKDNFTRVGFEKIINIEKIITIFYMEFSKHFHYDGESHDFWEMVYIDKGEMVCTSGNNRFTLKSGEMTFHKPNEFHNLSGNNTDFPNVSIITFECKSRAMKNFEGRIFKLNSEEKALLSELFAEGLSCYKLADETNPLLQKLKKLPNAPEGSSQMTKNLFEILLIKLARKSDSFSKEPNKNHVIDGVDIPYNVKEIIDFLTANIYGRITLETVAQAVGKSQSAVKKQFSGFYRDGIIKYYNNLKIKEAKKLIREGKHNMTEISDMLCFDNPQYFSKCFKMYTNKTPSEYKASIIK